MFVFVCIFIFEIESFVVFISTLQFIEHFGGSVTVHVACVGFAHIFDINLITEHVVICSSADFSFHILSLIGVSCGHNVRNARDEQPIFLEKPSHGSTSCFSFTYTFRFMCECVWFLCLVAVFCFVLQISETNERTKKRCAHVRNDL